MVVKYIWMSLSLGGIQFWWSKRTTVDQKGACTSLVFMLLKLSRGPAHLWKRLCKPKPGGSQIRKHGWNWNSPSHPNRLVPVMPIHLPKWRHWSIVLVALEHWIVCYSTWLLLACHRNQNARFYCQTYPNTEKLWETIHEKLRPKCPRCPAWSCWPGSNPTTQSQPSFYPHHSSRLLDPHSNCDPSDLPQ